MVGVNGDSYSDITRSSSNQPTPFYTGEDDINLSTLRHRIDDMIRLYERERASQ